MTAFFFALKIRNYRIFAANEEILRLTFNFHPGNRFR